MKKTNMFHMLPMSPWPIISSINTNITFMNIILMLKKKSDLLLATTVLSLSISSIMWWNTMKRENTLYGLHNKISIQMFKFSLILFIISEICLFISMFWNYMHNAWSPNVETGSIWPPHLMNINNPYLLPIYGTCALLSSGIFITLSHHYLIKNNFNKTSTNLIKTIFLGIAFLDMQMSEYTFSNFSLMAFNDSSFSSIFFMITGLHGSHVLVGIIFLSFPLIFLKKNSISIQNHNSFSLSAWYWHFVDIIWLFVYFGLYYINA